MALCFYFTLLALSILHIQDVKQKLDVSLIFRCVSTAMRLSSRNRNRLRLSDASLVLLQQKSSSVPFTTDCIRFTIPAASTWTTSVYPYVYPDYHINTRLLP